MKVQCRKLFWFLVAALFGGGAIKMGITAFQEYQQHPGTRGMTELAAGLSVVAFMFILMVMAINAGRAKMEAKNRRDENRADGNSEN